MKKGLLLSILGMMVFVSASYGQTEMRPRAFELGLYAAPTLNWFSSTEQYDNKGICLGGSYGLNVEINLFRTASNYYFHTGVNIHQFGGKLQYAYSDTSASQTRFAIDKHNITYVSIPTAIKLATNPILKDRFMVFGVFGLDNALRVSSTVKKDKDYNNKTVKNNDNTALFKESLLVTIGGEYVISGNTRLIAGVNFNFGFTNAFKKDFIGDETVQARTLGLQIGLIF